jgi:hypothetical protein
MKGGRKTGRERRGKGKKKDPGNRKSSLDNTQSPDVLCGLQTKVNQYTD